MGDVTNVLQNVLSAKESSKIVDENGNAPTQKKGRPRMALLSVI
jgi:hypothetical protein